MSERDGFRDWNASTPPFVKSDGLWYFVARDGSDFGPFDARWRANIVRGQYYSVPREDPADE